VVSSRLAAVVTKGAPEAGFSMTSPAGATPTTKRLAMQAAQSLAAERVPLEKRF